MNIRNTMRELYEQVRKYDDLLDIPQSVKYSKHIHSRSGIDNLLREVEQFNKFPNDKSSLTDCKRLFNNAMRLIEELMEEQTKLNYDYDYDVHHRDCEYGHAAPSHENATCLCCLIHLAKIEG